MQAWLRVAVAAVFVPLWISTALANDLRAHIRVVAFGMSSASPVFEKEATKAADIVATRFGAEAPIVRANTEDHTDAKIEDLRASLMSVGGEMDRDRDILVLILSSHGSRAGVAVTSWGFYEDTLSPAALRDLLAKAGIRRRVLIVSACYSGVFAEQLADADTLVITAADSRHTSFGCGALDEWTYFGQAFFAEALPISRSFADAFVTARGLIGLREFLEGLTPSHPQMAGGWALWRSLEPPTKTAEAR